MGWVAYPHKGLQVSVCRGYDLDNPGHTDNTRIAFDPLYVQAQPAELKSVLTTSITY